MRPILDASVAVNAEDAVLLASTQADNSKQLVTIQGVLNVAKICLPPIAVAVFISKLDPKTSIEIAMAGAMALATGSAPLAELVNMKYPLSDRQRQWIAMALSSSMAAGVGIMEMGAAEKKNQSSSAAILFAGVTGFCVFVATMVLHNFLVLCG